MRGVMPKLLIELVGHGLNGAGLLKKATMIPMNTSILMTQMKSALPRAL